MATSDLDFEALQSRGFLVLPNLVPQAHLDRFEHEIAVLSEGECRRLGTSPAGDVEPFIHLHRQGGEYWSLLYELLERMFVLNQIATDIGRFLEETEFLRREGIEVPLVWPDIRADPPHDSSRLLRIHQDFASTRCHRAWRLWVPLRPADEHYGTMRVFAGTHRLGLLPHRVDDPRYPTVDAEHWQDAPQETMVLPAGHGVLFHPLLLHESVPNRSNRMKFTLLVQVQDLASVCHPHDPDDPLSEFVSLTAVRRDARARESRPSIEAAGGPSPPAAPR